MNPRVRRSSSYLAFEGDRCIAAGDLRTVARAAKECSIGARKPRSRLRQQQAARSISISAVRSTMCWRDCPPLAPPSQRKMPPSPRRAVPAGRNSAWSRARSRCCRGTGNGWRSNPAAPRSRCAGWSMRRGAPTRTRTGSGRRRKRPIVSSRRWRENKPHYEEVARALFAGDAERFEAWTAAWPADVRDHARRLAAAAFEPVPARDRPVDPADVNR